jgi:hypothetical protein
LGEAGGNEKQRGGGGSVSEVMPLEHEGRCSSMEVGSKIQMSHAKLVAPVAAEVVGSGVVRG